MDAKLQSLLGRVKGVADRTGRSVGRAADAAGRKATEMAAATRLNLRIFDINTECDVLFRDIGRMVYELHRGDEVTNEEMDAKLAEARIAAGAAGLHALGLRLPELRQSLLARGPLLSRLRNRIMIV